MKSKLSWLPFIPLALAACFFKLAQGFLPAGAVFGLSALYMEYIYLGAVVLIFIFAFIFCMMDKEIAKYYEPRRNIAAGIIGLLTAFLLAADGANNVMNLFSAGKMDVLNLAESILAMLSAVIFVVMGLNHTFRNKMSKRFSLLYAFPALLCAVRMILSFVSFTTISLRLADVSSLICYIFATMFFYYYAVALSLIPSKRAIKYCFVLGLPACAVLIPYGISALWFSFDSVDLLNNLRPLEMLFFGLYILSFLIELTIFIGDEKSVAIVTEEEKAPNPTGEEKVQGFFASSKNEDESDVNLDPDVLEQRDTNDFLVQEVKNENDQPYHTVGMEEEMQHYLTEDTSFKEDEVNNKGDYESKLDDIDKLIIKFNDLSV